MKKIVYGLVMATSGSLMASHDAGISVAPKLFYQNHSEYDYEYEIYGIGFQYTVESAMGIGFRSSVCTNLSKNEPLNFLENEMYYRIIAGETVTLFPNITTQIINHTLDSNEERLLFTNKATHNFGLNIEKEFPSSWKANIGIHLFKNFSNNVTMKKSNEFFGQTYENPFGLKFMGKVGKELSEGFKAELGGYFSKTFTRNYRTFGFDLTFKWDF